MKKFSLLILFFTIISTTVALAQKIESINFRQSQSRIAEPNMEVFVRPLVVDLEVIGEDRIEEVCSFPNVRLTELSLDMLQNLKASALFNCSQKYNADVIIAAMFDIQSFEDNKGYGINVTVVGYPAKYKNWKPAIENSEYQWILDVYGTAIGYKQQGNAIDTSASKTAKTTKLNVL